MQDQNTNTALQQISCSNYSLSGYTLFKPKFCPVGHKVAAAVVRIHSFSQLWSLSKMPGTHNFYEGYPSRSQRNGDFKKTMKEKRFMQKSVSTISNPVYFR